MRWWRLLAKTARRLPHKRLLGFWIMSVVTIMAPWVARMLPASEQPACQVRSVYDGDTVTLTCEGKRQKVRLYCIDAPEMSQKPWGRESRDVLRQILSQAREVRVRAKNRDRYGRTVGELLADGRVVNVELVRRGAAAVYGNYCPQWQRSYWKAQDQAKREGVGIWEKPGEHQRPWEYRRRTR